MRLGHCRCLLLGLGVTAAGLTDWIFASGGQTRYWNPSSHAKLFLDSLHMYLNDMDLMEQKHRRGHRVLKTILALIARWHHKETRPNHSRPLYWGKQMTAR